MNYILNIFLYIKGDSSEESKKHKLWVEYVLKYVQAQIQ